MKFTSEAFHLMRSTHPRLKSPLLHFDQFRPWRAGKKEILIRQGEGTRLVRFLISGLARLLFVDENGVEQTKYFLGPGFFLIPIHSFFFEKDSWFTIQTSTPCRGLAIDSLTFKNLLSSDLQWSNYWNSYLTQLFIAKEERERQFLTLGAQEKYMDLLTCHPEIAQHVSLHQIASYLGVTDVTLSRIRRTIQSKK